MIKKWKLAKSESIFDSPYLKLSARQYKLPSGETKGSYYHIDRADYVLIVAVDDADHIALVRQYRRGVDEILFELPAGWIDSGEKPEQAAIRELREETGLTGKAKYIGKLYSQPGFISMICHVVKVNVDQKLEQKLEHDEDIEVKSVPLADIEVMIKNGDLADMGALAALSLYLADQARSHPR